MLVNEFEIRLERVASTLHPDFGRDALVALSRELVACGELSAPLPPVGTIPEPLARELMQRLLEGVRANDPDFRQMCLDALEESQ